jgi:hypothetical protein
MILPVSSSAVCNCIALEVAKLLPSPFLAAQQLSS